ncbi:hypothetical protein, partial [Actinomadura hibisca]|uniref:hypothetical protein n=1 Tax=Actinomadura hibisca TaxID=68565 RepID=UPI000AFCCDF4
MPVAVGGRVRRGQRLGPGGLRDARLRAARSGDVPVGGRLRHERPRGLRGLLRRGLCRRGLCRRGLCRYRVGVRRGPHGLRG